MHQLKEVQLAFIPKNTVDIYTTNCARQSPKDGMNSFDYLLFFINKENSHFYFDWYTQSKVHIFQRIMYVNHKTKDVVLRTNFHHPEDAIRDLQSKDYKVRIYHKINKTWHTLAPIEAPKGFTYGKHLGARHIITCRYTDSGYHVGTLIERIDEDEIPKSKFGFTRSGSKLPERSQMHDTRLEAVQNALAKNHRVNIFEFD